MLGARKFIEAVLTPGILPAQSISTFGGSMAFSFRQALNAVKSRVPSAVRKASFNATANQSPQLLTSPRAAYTDLTFDNALMVTFLYVLI